MSSSTTNFLWNRIPFLSAFLFIFCFLEACESWGIGIERYFLMLIPIILFKITQNIDRGKLSAEYDFQKARYLILLSVFGNKDIFPAENLEKVVAFINEETKKLNREVIRLENEKKK